MAPDYLHAAAQCFGRHAAPLAKQRQIELPTRLPERMEQLRGMRLPA